MTEKTWLAIRGVNKEETNFYKVRNVKNKVKKAISQYCAQKGITQANYLETDRRIKNLLEQ